MYKKFRSRLCLDLNPPYWAKKQPPPLAADSLSCICWKSSRRSFSVAEELKGRNKVFRGGSESLQEVESAFYVPQNKISRLFKLDDLSRVFTAEAIATLEALKYFRFNNVGKPLAIMPDSMSVLKATNNRKSFVNTNPLIVDIIFKCITLNQLGVALEFFRVRHAAILNLMKW